MNTQVASSRIKDVLDVDSMNYTQANFLATHVPFRKIRVVNDLSGAAVSESLSEEEIFNNYFCNTSLYDSHQFIIVDGSSGSGKSHFIRWIQAKLEALENQNDVVMMIRRSDNTLKGTIKQFLDREEIKNLKNRDVYERLVKANQNVSEKRFKDEIYHKFIIEVADDEDNDSDLLSGSDRRKLKELLSSTEFEERMLMPGGPIERIYSRIVSEDTASSGEKDACFIPADFTLSYEFNEKLKKNASKKAVSMANNLLELSDGSFEDDDCNPKVIADFMNSKVDKVVLSCAGIQPGDFQQIFQEIRQELYNQGKNLILLVEDITSCTGINRDLLNALIISHKGEYESKKMCRLVSVLGTTTEYFAPFRSNYIHRITTGITIEDGAIGENKDDLIQFVAKYLNAVSLDSSVVEEWCNNGAQDSEYPIHTPNNVDWESYDYNGKKISLYPFTKKAIINLYDGLNFEKIPRFIIRKIIQPAVDNILNDRDSFPRFIANVQLQDVNVEMRVKQILASIDIPSDKLEETINRALAIIKYWGDGTLNVSGKRIGTASSQIYKEYKLQPFAEAILGGKIGEDAFEESMTIEPNNQPVAGDSNSGAVGTVSKPVTNKAFEDFARTLSDWYYQKGMFVKAFQIRDTIGKFVFATIEWQREGVPLISVDTVQSSSYNLFTIEDQDRSADKGLIMLKRSDENYRILLAFGRYYHLGKESWNYDKSYEDIIVATKWLEKNKAQFVETVKDFNSNEDIVPPYVANAMLAEVYRGVINGDYQTEKISDIKCEYLLREQSSRKKTTISGHSDKWNELRDNIIYLSSKTEDNINIVHRYFNIIQGVKKANTQIMQYSLFEETFKSLKKQEFIIEKELIATEKYKARNDSGDYLKSILSKIGEVVAAEKTEAIMCHSSVCKYLGFRENTDIESYDIKDLLNEIIDFYDDIDTAGIAIQSRKNDAKNMKDSVNLLIKSLEKLNSDMSDMSDLQFLIHFSSNPMKIVKEFLCLLEDVESDYKKVDNQMQTEKEALTRKGKWSDNTDPRFMQQLPDFEALIASLEVK